MMKYEIVEKQIIRKKFATQADFDEEYRKHTEYGSSGEYNDRDKIGIIRSFLTVCRKLELDGYRNLHFSNGGDDDTLLIDHKNKEFGFFEDNDPTEEQMEHSKNLTHLWKTCS